jgi:hypothetical protein
MELGRMAFELTIQTQSPKETLGTELTHTQIGDLEEHH